MRFLVCAEQPSDDAGVYMQWQLSSSDLERHPALAIPAVGDAAASSDGPVAQQRDGGWEVHVELPVMLAGIASGSTAEAALALASVISYMPLTLGYQQLPDGRLQWQQSKDDLAACTQSLLSITAVFDVAAAALPAVDGDGGQPE
jgi:hypothetical protein